MLAIVRVTIKLKPLRLLRKLVKLYHDSFDCSVPGSQATRCWLQAVEVASMYLHLTFLAHRETSISFAI